MEILWLFAFGFFVFVGLSFLIEDSQPFKYAEVEALYF